jgi:hypothetical protein
MDDDPLMSFADEYTVGSACSAQPAGCRVRMRRVRFAPKGGFPAATIDGVLLPLPQAADLRGGVDL